jgi:flagellar motility protein MotE (MotC chaperone)
MRILPIVGSMLLASALLRGVGIAGAETAMSPSEDEAAASTAPELMSEGVEGTEAMLEAFRAREERLVLREAQLDDRLQALAVAEAEISEKLAALTEAEASLRALLAVAETAAQDDLAQLTSVYESMKPADASAIFAEMDPNLAAGFLGMMQPESAAAVMAGLEPGVAYAISALLAGRHAAVPTE